MKVQAVLSLEVGGRLVVDDLDIGEPGPTHVVVKQFAITLGNDAMSRIRLVHIQVRSGNISSYR